MEEMGFPGRHEKMCIVALRGDVKVIFRLESLATTVEPKCGSCRCGKCLIPGSRYSHQEEVELKMIEGKLNQDRVLSGCGMGYFWLYDRELLKGLRQIAMKMLQAT